MPEILGFTSLTKLTIEKSEEESFCSILNHIPFLKDHFTHREIIVAVNIPSF